MKPERSFLARFPEGKRKALVISYDDGSEHDRRVVAILNAYGLRGTFNLNSGRLGQPHHISKGEVQALYKGHEVASHGANHLDLTQLSDAQIDREVGDDRMVLEDLVGAAVRGLAYPFGRFDEHVIGRLPALGVVYARTAHTTGRFGLPERPLALTTSCHHNEAGELGARFLQHDAEEMGLLAVWGHSFELDGFLSTDPGKNWGYFEAFCQLVHGHPDIHYATTFDVVDYLSAARVVMASAATGRVRNDTHRSVWFSHAGCLFELPAGVGFDLAGGCLLSLDGTEVDDTGAFAS